ncbi:TPA: protoporphyrinogen oxidase HemJ [Campylobacter lari]|uniref:protoporphyrinogen oxidase HemJ n=1 Tax=Campylobacter lari TaxID=201 RepID=UPI00182E4A12|nr:protoporphyrinogen oxidase HemJ [Campylobacter lari]EAI8646603.1 protoporphyrinogen oxidase HemJ [Campylobacter lari]EAJ5686620.1 protoporphyrinogen oxidase HemJ [Campylobacter lari]ECP5283808.1 protoporphyrinogen oxidase HemJ [Campylobacter lari]ELW5249715.1 protoporphyrinogen oxidase HemJ [Campylobacter lari]MBX2682739.1 protoporphyrinogen oxidase HemJ [Campylobacter lari]
MLDFLTDWYLWIKMVHYLAFVSWMAGLFYLPRLFVYHTEHKDNKGFVEVVKIQERKLYFYIQTPAMIVTLISGSLMLHVNKVLMVGSGFMHAKLTCALLLIIYHLQNYYYLKQLQNDTCQKSGKFFRAYNEIPTILFIIIAIMMVVRPF